MKVSPDESQPVVCEYGVLRKSRVLERLRQGKHSKCIKINLADPRVIEICGMLGVDVVWLCGEHVANDWACLENQIRAADIYNLDVFVRVSKGSYSDYIKPLELGAKGIIVPDVRSRSEAEKIVDICRFAPLGSRALDGGNRDGMFASIETDIYLKHSTRNQSIVVQIESEEGLNNLKEIGRVAGIDILFFGPSDFAHKSGFPGQFDREEVVSGRAKVAECASENGKYLMEVRSGHKPGLDGPPRIHVLTADVVLLWKSLEETLAQYSEGYYY